MSSARGAASSSIVALVAAEDGVGEVEEDDRRLGEVGVALVLQPPGSGEVAGHLRLDELGREDRALLGHVVHERLAVERPVVDLGAAIPRRPLPEALGRGVGVGLGGVEAGRIGGVGRVGGRVERLVGPHVLPVERLRRRPDRLAAEAERLALVLGQAGRGPVPGEDGEDRDGLAELAQARDQPAAREGDVVGVGGDENMGHGPASIPIEPRREPPVARRRTGRVSGTRPRRRAGRRRSRRASSTSGARPRARPAGGPAPSAPPPGSRAARPRRADR